jgi:hypothetical protein
MSRLEYINKQWVPKYFPPNLGSPRDIPDGAVMHPSIDEMLDAGIMDQSMKPYLGEVGFWYNVRRLLGLKQPDQKPTQGTTTTRPNGVNGAGEA